MMASNHSKTVLIAEDDDNTSNLLIRYFEKEGFCTKRAENGNQALDLARRFSPNLVILDLMLPEIDGWEVCEELRSVSDIPILILSARQEESDRILGFKLGADDYVVKPFSPREVVARANAILRRSSSLRNSPDAVLRIGDLCVDTDKHCCTVLDVPLKLTNSEFILLKTLMSRAGRVLTRNELLDELHADGQCVVDRVVDVHIASIRQKISAITDFSEHIVTVRGVGYRMDL